MMFMFGVVIGGAVAWILPESVKTTVVEYVKGVIGL